LIIHVGDTVIRRSTGDMYSVSETETKFYGCGCKMTKRIKLFHTDIGWVEAKDFRLLDKDDF